MLIRVICFISALSLALFTPTLASVATAGGDGSPLDPAACSAMPFTDSLSLIGEAAPPPNCGTLKLELVEKHMRCPAVTGAFCDNLSHACCLVSNVYKCCPSLDSDCCKE